MHDHRTRGKDRTTPTAGVGCVSVPSPIHSTCHDALGHVVRYTRAQRGLSQEELGHRAALHRNGRTLVLYFEHTEYDTFVDAAGGTVHNPTETKYTGTLDGVPIEVQAFSMRGRESVTVRTDQGTFTATNTDYPEDHPEALRRYLEHRPSEGYQVAIVDSAQDGDMASYTVAITNGHLTEHAEFRLSEQVMRTLARGAEAPTDEQVVHEIAQQVRRDKWAKIRERAERPTTLMWMAHPS